MKKHLLAIPLLLAGACAAPGPDTAGREGPRASAAAAPRAGVPTLTPITDAPPPLVKRQIPPPGSQPTPLGQRVLGMMVYFLTGTFDTVEQLPTDGDSTPVRLQMKSVWPERQGESWLYAEFALKSDLGHPFRQRLMRFREAGGDVYADVFVLPGDPARWVGEWAKAKPFATLSPDQLREDPRCRELFEKQLEAIFAGGNATDTCPAETSGAAYLRAEYYISSNSIRFWQRDFDASGKQASGPHGPWEFRKIAR